ncbi:protein phosphatase 2C-like protein (plasmid) [Pseudomonas sp. Leaf58]|uniref:ceramidase domain-containing protein n=1 Tax=Pseudomonas sp. Leaf58 TaxID=1736226 RepID=UPI00070211A8|nr:ceramidase domain-containing protein [Pseudomonas sp. Leaf58]AYG48223.1 protein phosphatase 2C-like protein [Pseudomonas sp. Leaf58]KQN62229.1 hypothetical protein ASF02_08685 [Pseudomonas sp. Leaf58]
MWAPLLKNPYKWGAVLLVTLLALIVVGTMPRIPQDVAYHAFGDHRYLLGISNFWNVVSNLPFVIVGWLGLRECRRQTSGHTPPGFVMQELPWAGAAFFAGVLLTGLGSGYYHFEPTNQSLIWDRLPMTISFMAFFSIIIGCHADLSAARLSLWPLLILGIASVVYWSYTEGQGAGDLRAYVIVQFLPILLIPILVKGSGSLAFQGHVIWKVLGLYVLAKVLEHWDHAIYALLHFEMAGHAIKHAAAAMATYVVLLEIKDGWTAFPQQSAISGH